MDVQTAAANVAEDYKGGARQLAIDIDRNPTTFSHQITETGSAVLGLKTAVKMSRRAKDFRILYAFAAECGHMCVPLPDALMVEGDMTMQRLGLVAKEFADVVAEVSGSVADDRISDNEMQHIERQWGELVAAGQQLLTHLRAKHECSKPAATHLRRA